MKFTAKNVAFFVHKTMNRTRTNTISMSLGDLKPKMLTALRKDYGFVEVKPEALGYTNFKRNFNQ